MASQFYLYRLENQWLTAATPHLYKQKAKSLSIHFPSVSKAGLWCSYKGTGIRSWTSQQLIAILTLTESHISATDPFSSAPPQKSPVQPFLSLILGLTRTSQTLWATLVSLFHRHPGVIPKNWESTKYHHERKKGTLCPSCPDSPAGWLCLTTHHVPEADLPRLVTSCHKDDALGRVDGHGAHSVLHHLPDVLLAQDHAAQAVLVPAQHGEHVSRSRRTRQHLVFSCCLQITFSCHTWAFPYH